MRAGLCLICWAGMAQAEVGSLFPRDTGGSVGITRSSLVVTDRSEGLFAALPPRQAAVPPSVGPIAQLLDLIAEAEAGSAGYDAVQYGARIRPDRLPTQMTLGEIYAWIEATPGQPHAIGRYQFIPPTLRRVASLRGFGPEVRFTPEVQDALAMILLEDAGLARFEAGTLPRRAFMRNLARIWAGLPLPNGQSYYEGYAGNSAAMSWARFERGMARIWPG